MITTINTINTNPPTAIPMIAGTGSSKELETCDCTALATAVDSELVAFSADVVREEELEPVVPVESPVVVGRVPVVPTPVVDVDAELEVVVVPA